ncbi:MAG: HD domain-containing protein [Microlunatus sp.]
MSSVSTLGDEEVFVEPLWRVELRLSGLEQELLKTWWVRRLGFVSHAGAASITTVQSYTRLEHSLGLLALVVHFAPDDREARAAALLHDIGHLPFSHTFEHSIGLDHHVIGADRIRDLAPLLSRHGIDPETVVGIVDGHVPSVLSGPRRGMRLDHLESFVRSGRAHGRTTVAPHVTLSRLRLEGGAIDTDAETAEYLRDLVVGEAQSQVAPRNLGPMAVMQQLANSLLADPTARTSAEQLAAMTDDEFWAAVLSCPATRDLALRLRTWPDLWSVTADEPAMSNGLKLWVRRLYLDLPLIGGHPSPPIDPAAHGLPHVPAQFAIVPITQ